jgi:hypothetical protein
MPSRGGIVTPAVSRQNAMSNLKTMATYVNPVSMSMNMNPDSMNNRSIVPRTVMST